MPAFTIDEHEYADTTPCESKMFQSLGKTFSNREFQKFVSSDVLYWIALTLFQTGLPFYITVLMRPSLLSMYRSKDIPPFDRSIGAPPL